ncbi:acyl carrier protein [Kitasatospora sp. NPDC048540]|uniref:acyl carrier protein n=1 Tax=unclassified Kitasatospora TaxID=2633591 RepID=UPI00068FE285|nr:acyl carrier protein [Kitasatospora sp. MBT63]
MNATPATAAPLRDRLREALATLLGHPLAAADDEVSLAEIVPERYDSLGVLDAVGLVEKEFGVPVDLVVDDLRSTFFSVATIAALIERKQRDAAVLGLLP